MAGEARRPVPYALRAAFGSGWRIESLAADRFDLNPGLGTPTAEAWLTNVVRLVPGSRFPPTPARSSHDVAKDFDRIADALGLVIGSEAMISLTDAVGLDIPTARGTLLDAGRWLLSGALAELTTEPASSQLLRRAEEAL